jgi:hypothetical protein
MKKETKCQQKMTLKLLIVAVLILSFQLSIAQEKETDTVKAKKEKKKLSFKDPEDGAFDVSSFLIDPEGFMPIPIIITQPAVGYGGGLAALFIKPQKKKYDVHVPPNITGVFGLATSNGTWAGGVGHFHDWGPDKYRYVGGVAKPYINIDYYGAGGALSEELSKNPVEFNMDAWAVVQRLQVRVKKSNLFLGGAYLFYQTKTSFAEVADRPIIDELLNKLESTTTLSAIKPMANWDSRDNIFTPTKGINTGVIYTYNATWLGASKNYQEISPYFLGYKKHTDNVFSGWRFDSAFTNGDAPFYAKPYIQMRGVPAMKYQNNNTMLAEMQWTFKTYKRWKLDVFTGTGKAFESFQDFGQATWVYNYGVGFRYEIARLFGIDAGMDFAWSNDGDFAFSIVFGTAWNK